MERLFDAKTLLILAGGLCVAVALAWLDVRADVKTQRQLVSELQNQSKEIEIRYGAAQGSQTNLALPASLFWSTANEYDTEIEVQRELGYLCEEYGLRVVNIGLSGKRELEGQTELEFEMEVQGELSSLISVLADVEGVVPRLSVERLAIRGNSLHSNEVGSEVTAQFSVVAFWKDFQGLGRARD